MRRIQRVRGTLADGQERTYLYAINGHIRRELGVTSSVLQRQYRSREQRRIVAALRANSSLLVVGEAGCGKTVLGEAVASELSFLGYRLAIAHPAPPKQVLLSIAEQTGVETISIQGKNLTTTELQDAIADFLVDNTAFLIFDNAHRLQPSLRCWLEQLHCQGQPILMLATFPPARDIFLKLPRVELGPLSDGAIREIMVETAAELALVVSNAQLAELQQRCAGNPMLAQRVVREEYLGLDATSPDHTQWVDLTPFIVATLMCLIIVRFIGLGFNSTTLYLVGGILTIAVGVVRILLYSLPRSTGKLGR